MVRSSHRCLRVRCLDLRLEILPWGDDALRVRATRNTTLPPEDHVLLPVSAGQEPRIQIRDDEIAQIQITTGITDMESQAGEWRRRFSKEI